MQQLLIYPSIGDVIHEGIRKINANLFDIRFSANSTDYELVLEAIKN